MAPSPRLRATEPWEPLKPEPVKAGPVRLAPATVTFLIIPAARNQSCM